MKLATAVVLAMLLASSSGLAEDYTVDFAIKTRDGADTGSIACRFDELCDARVDSLRLSFNVSISRGNLDRARLNMYGDSGCCLFEGAVRTLTIVPDKQPSLQRIFIGQPAKGLEFIENEQVGNLYLKFRFRADRSLKERGDMDGYY